MGKKKRLPIDNIIHIKQNRRDSIYKFLKKKFGGFVPCFVCHQHVKPHNATIEHIVPKSLGGSDEMSNLSVSHYSCNKARGSDVNFTWKKFSEEQLDDENIPPKLPSEKKE